MLIHDMTQQASIDLLARIRLGRLACAHEGQPYITPIYCAYDDNYLYSFSTLGQKIAWMRQIRWFAWRLTNWSARGIGQR